MPCFLKRARLNGCVSCAGSIQLELCSINGFETTAIINQRKLGSNTSVLRTNRILRLEMMKGGARLRLDLDEGWCETLHDITIHHIET